MTFTYTWDAAFEAAPTNDNYGYEIDDYIRKLAIAVRERMEIDHIWKVGATDGLVKAHRSRFSAYNSLPQILPDGTTTLVKFQTEVYDNLSEYASGNTSTFTAQEDGIYLFNVRLVWTGNPNGITKAFISVEDATGNGLILYDINLNIVQIISLTAGQTVKVYAAVAAGDAITLSGADYDRCIFQGQRLA